jgi:predicted DCC family thiol-disulfide oxidoreductase YuxK
VKTPETDIAPIALLIFDGDCGFCTSSANYVTRKAKGKIEAHPWQFLNLAEHNLTQEQAEAKVQLIRHGKIYSGHEAFVQFIQIAGPKGLRTISRLALVKPFSFLAAGCYWLVARYRHKLPGGTPACKLPN